MRLVPNGTPALSPWRVPSERVRRGSAEYTVYGMDKEVRVPRADIMIRLSLARLLGNLAVRARTTSRGCVWAAQGTHPEGSDGHG